MKFLVESVLGQHSALKLALGTIFVGTAYIGGRFCVTGTVPKNNFSKRVLRKGLFCGAEFGRATSASYLRKMGEGYNTAGVHVFTQLTSSHTFSAIEMEDVVDLRAQRGPQTVEWRIWRRKLWACVRLSRCVSLRLRHPFSPTPEDYARSVVSTLRTPRPDVRRSFCCTWGHAPHASVCVFEWLIMAA
jgi:hypothetical protein